MYQVTEKAPNLKTENVIQFWLISDNGDLKERLKYVWSSDVMTEEGRRK
jgi:hypothetical protein